jgi:predicted P-loop ATPase/GTPase
MTKNILIIGLKNTDSGKTTLARAIISYLKDKNYKSCGFKPFSGNNIWYDFDIIDKTLSEGKIYSKDALLLKQESTIDVAIETMNPIHRIWNEPASIDTMTQLPNFIIDRITIYNKSKHKHLLIIIQDNLKQIPDRYLKKISKKYHNQHIINNIETLNKFIKKYYKKSIETNYQFIKNQCDYTIIESYADQALFEWDGLNHFDRVIAIKPWHILSYNPKKYEKALQVSKQLYSWETSTKKITDLLKPVKKIPIKPTRPDELIPYLKNKISSIINL